MNYRNSFRSVAGRYSTEQTNPERQSTDGPLWMREEGWEQKSRVMEEASWLEWNL